MILADFGFPGMMAVTSSDCYAQFIMILAVFLQQLAHEVTCMLLYRIFLIDHAWTYWPDQARSHLTSMPSLLSRMAVLMNVDADDRPQDDVIEDVLTLMWR